jgi:hypothetical protein
VPELKLAKLPDRTPAKITITVSAELNSALCLYAEFYRAVYEEAESVAALVPFMLEAFLESDRGFAKARKDGIPDSAPPPANQSPRAQRRDLAAPSSMTRPEG